MITLRYALTTADFAAFSTYVQLDAPGKKKAIYKRYLPLLLVFGVICIFNVYTSITADSFNIIDLVPFVVFAALILFPVFSMRIRLEKQAEKFAENSENTGIFRMTDYYFSETGVMTKDDVKETKYQWNAFIRKEETADYIYLFVYSSSGLIIPKKIFRSEVEKEQLAKLFAQYISFDAEVGHLVKS